MTHSNSASSLNESVLFLTPRSPFARRVRLAMTRAGVDFKLQETNVFEPAPDFLARNPLGLVPVLSLKDGRSLVDSAAIAEAIHDEFGGIWPSDRSIRLGVRLASTWAVGIMTAAVAYFLETKMHAVPDESWSKDHEAVVARTLAVIEASDLSGPYWISSEVDTMGELTQAGWDLAVALEYVTLRLPHLAWEAKHPKLKPLLERCRKSTAFRESTPPPM